MIKCSYLPQRWFSLTHIRKQQEGLATLKLPSLVSNNSPQKALNFHDFSSSSCYLVSTLFLVMNKSHVSHPDFLSIHFKSKIVRVCKNNLVQDSIYIPKGALGKAKKTVFSHEKAPSKSLSGDEKQNIDQKIHTVLNIIYTTTPLFIGPSCKSFSHFLTQCKNSSFALFP